MVGASLPPSGNTGVGITTGGTSCSLPASEGRSRPPGGIGISIGWLSATWVGYYNTPDDFLAWASSFFTAGLEYMEGRRWRGYDHTWLGEHGLMVGMKWRGQAAPSLVPGVPMPVDRAVLEVHLDVPATCLEALRLGRLVALLRSVNLHAHNVTRLDVTLDDWCKVITPAALAALTTCPDDRNTLVRDDIVTRAKTVKFESSAGDKRSGDTWYLGSTKGEQRLRVYDKFKESEGAVNAIRWELQLRDVWAKDALARLVGYIDQRKESGLSGVRALEAVAGSWAAVQLTYFVDFRDRNTDSNISRADRRFWWAALVMDATKSGKIERVDPPLTVARLHDHAYSNMLSLIATLADSAEAVLGMRPGEWFAEIVRLGRERRSPRHKLALRSAGVAA